MNKKGLSNVWATVIFILVFIIIPILAIWLYTPSQYETQYSQLKIDLVKEVKSGNIMGALGKLWDQKGFIFGEILPTSIGSVLGFKSQTQQVKDFILYFFTGALAGFWIWGSVKISSFGFWGLSKKAGEGETSEKKIAVKSTWIYLIGGDIWKIPAIGIFYAILMLIPILNKFIQIITFEVIMPGGILDGNLINPLIRSLIIAFYIGFGPTMIERYIRYRTRLKYFKQLEQVKYGIKMSKAMSSG